MNSSVLDSTFSTSFTPANSSTFSNNFSYHFPLKAEGLGMSHLLYLQKKRTSSFVTENKFYWSASTTARSQYSDLEKNEILKKANAYIKDNVVDLDPKMAILVNKNFKQLLWN